MNNLPLAARQLSALGGLEVNVALDDFGTGHSVLAQLKALPVDSLKLDRSFITELPGDEGDRQICIAIQSLASGFSLTTVAEAVETQAQAEALKAMGYNRMQGFLFAHPMPMK